ncbi:4Fe-4S dicluster domain-containing protein [Methanotrichaceae archaeon M04Ac]|jgi:ferredoxin|uniref:4Fe-4S dicluster domain-containing protein n=1 Tax=Candidatus Methanocrinis alkalitolerans TaxID=3033395 RepID=A0ABT5XDA7_9EURY|nr:4Fe-4S dicluster domain-containing protein [Candidatus Methanocrinis alkalitolerans]MCR3883305.1 4Fe-4S dicluster domain-containing protein [Methanothrix sp.]MDF0592676.1 4Fe-4S dicluster domain-containing protein [Candidatus Methanocrinis alkalitolerans]
MIRVDPRLCIGCLSCSNVCPRQNIIRTQTEEERRIRWKRCREECDLCVELCPAGALTLVPIDESAPEPEVSFPLVGCRICGRSYATEPMLLRVEAALPKSQSPEWVRICPTCRRTAEAERATGDMVAARRRRG